MRLRFTRPALADLDAVLDHIAAQSPAGAQRVQRRIKAIIEPDRAHPGIGRRTDDPAIRRIATAPYPYLIFYEATDAETIVHAVRHMARDPSGMPGAARRSA